MDRAGRTHQVTFAGAARAIGGVLGVAAGYYALTQVVMAAAIPPGRGVPVWVPMGFALALLLRHGWIVLPGVGLGSFAASLPFYTPLWLSASLAAAPVAGLAIALPLLRRLGVTGQYPTSSLAAVRLGGGAGLALLVGPILSTPLRVMSGYLPADAAWQAWWRWWLGDLAAVVIVTPAILAWLTPATAERRPAMLVEGGALLAATAAFGIGRAWLGTDRWVQDAAYFGLALVLWAAFRFGARMVTTTVLLLTVGMMAGAVVAVGGLHVPLLGGGLASLQMFFVVLGTTGLVLSATVAERQAVAAALRESHEALDQTVRRRTAALAEANAAIEARLAELRLTQFSIDRASFAILWLERDGRIAYLNDAAVALAGGTRERYAGRGVWHYDPELTPQRWPEVFDAVRRSAVLRRETTLARFDGRTATVEMTASHVVFDDRELVVVYATDVTERRRVEDQLRETQKMEALGTLAGGIAHDFNNLLAGILGFANVVVEESPPGSAAHAAGRTIEQAAHRAAELTQQLLGYARRGKVRQAPVDLHAVVASAVSIASRTMDRAIVIRTDLCDGAATIVGDAGQVEQVLINLLLNARDAMPSGGTVTVSTRRQALDEAYCQAHVEATPGPHVALRVEDTGVGMPSDVRARVFEPFYTTKPEGRGTGMGLPMVYGIVGNHGGHVTVESEPGRGTTVTTWWPLADVPLPVAEDTPAAPMQAGHGTVIVVDDEPVVRQMAGRLLERLGYTPLLAATGEEAVRLGTAHPDAVVLLDLVMPGLDGRDTYLALRAAVPSIAVVVSSGFSLDGRGQELLDLGARAFLQKPYTLRQLSETIALARA